MIAIGPNFDWAAYAANGNSTVPQPGSQAWTANMNRQIQQQLASIPQPQIPQFQQYQAPQQQSNDARSAAIAQMLGGPGGAGAVGEDPRLTSILAQLQGQAGQTDSYLNDQAAQSVASQRAVMQRNLEKSLTQSLSARGLLPGGGNVAKLRSELAAPMEEQLAAQQEQIRQSLLGQRTGTSNNIASQLADLQKSKQAGASDQQRLQMEMQLNQQRLGQDQQRFQWEMQRDQQRSAYDQAMMQYRMQQDALQTQLQQQAAQAAQGTGFSGNTGYRPSGSQGGTNMTGFGNGLPSGFDINPGSTRDIGRGREAAFNSESNRQLRAEQAARGEAAQSAWRSSQPGSGQSSAGSYTGISFDPISAAGRSATGAAVSAAQGYNPSNYNSMYQSGYDTARNSFSQMDSLSGPIGY